MIAVKTRSNLDCNQSWVLQAFAERSGGGLGAPVAVAALSTSPLWQCL